jgi:ABC-type Fe3+/spermidine/putrescine transport system ATPase subunit
VSAVVARNLVKRFGATRAVADVSFAVEDGSVLTLLGPSGCGKTTILRCLAGLETPDEGTITIAGACVFDGGRGTVVPTERRNLGMVFQSYAIWPHLTVFDNVAFGLRVRRTARGEIAARVAEALALVRLTGLEQRYPSQLSGGQQQRVVLARCLAYRPALLLLDEPLANLDAQLREEMRGELRRIQRQTGTTMVYVTHDQAEALALSDEVLVMDRGRVVQRAAPADLYRRPAAAFVAEFLGATNRLEARVLEDGTLEVLGVGRLAGIRPPGGAVSVIACLRPADILLVPLPAPGAADWTGIVESALYLGEAVEYRIRSGERVLTVRGAAEARLRDPGETVGLRIDPARVALFPADGTAAARP